MALMPAASARLLSGGLRRRHHRLAAWRLDSLAVEARPVAGDELLGAQPRHLIGDLVWRRLHEVRGGTLERAADAPVDGQLAAAHRVDDDPGAVRRVVNLQLELEVERDVTEGAALEAD